jgi:hypothetical protein
MPGNVCGLVKGDRTISKQGIGVKHFKICKREFHVTVKLTNCILRSH